MNAEAVEAERQRVAQADQRVAALRARVEHTGATLHIVGAAGGPPSFIVSRWCLSKDLADVDALEAWLAMVERKG